MSRFTLLSEVLLYNNLIFKILSKADDLDNRVAALRAVLSQKVQQELKFVKTRMDMLIKNFEVQLQISKLAQYNSAVTKAEAGRVINLHGHKKIQN
jgi:allantoinase/DNA mismatch repair protein MutS2